MIQRVKVPSNKRTQLTCSLCWGFAVTRAPSLTWPGRNGDDESMEKIQGVGVRMDGVTCLTSVSNEQSKRVPARLTLMQNTKLRAQRWKRVRAFTGAGGANRSTISEGTAIDRSPSVIIIVLNEIAAAGEIKYTFVVLFRPDRSALSKHRGFTTWKPDCLRYDSPYGSRRSSIFPNVNLFPRHETTIITVK